MQEYKRDRNTVETQLKDMTKRTAYHDDHLRVIDAWFSQVKIWIGIPVVGSEANGACCAAAG